MILIFLNCSGMLLELAHRVQWWSNYEYSSYNVFDWL